MAIKNADLNLLRLLKEIFNEFQSHQWPKWEEQNKISINKNDF